ncbi:MAG: TIGR00645 family protein [Verrucomicrobia bacterium]|nr:TIGR00645 family protein [Prolixibacteraceae bacterium]
MTNRAPMIEKRLEQFIFFSRWLQVPVYLGLIVASILYTIKFMIQLWNLMANFSVMDENNIMLAVLGLVDISMVINLLVVVFIGGYWTFVSKIEFENHHDKPDWLTKINASTLKIKLIISLVSISGVHLLKTFVDIHHVALQDAVLQISIHLVFILSALALAFTDKVMHSYHADSTKDSGSGV